MDGKERASEPFNNPCGCCPKCGDKKYWPLICQRCQKKCAGCGEEYDCIASKDGWRRMISVPPRKIKKS